MKEKINKLSALTSWSPGDYKRAGNKHYQTCIQLLSDVNKNRLERDITLQAVLFDIYYLGGYVIECLLKYYILKKETKPNSNQKIRDNDKLTMNDLKALGLIDHKIKDLSTTANENGGKNINFNQKSSLFKNWSEQTRYGLTTTQLDQTEVEKYIQEITTVRTQLLD